MRIISTLLGKSPTLSVITSGVFGEYMPCSWPLWEKFCLEDSVWHSTLCILCRIRPVTSSHMPLKHNRFVPSPWLEWCKIVKIMRHYAVCFWGLVKCTRRKNTCETWFYVCKCICKNKDEHLIFIHPALWVGVWCYFDPTFISSIVKQPCFSLLWIVLDIVYPHCWEYTSYSRIQMARKSGIAVNNIQSQSELLWNFEVWINLFHRKYLIEIWDYNICYGSFPFRVAELIR